MAAAKKVGRKSVKKGKPAYQRILLKLSGESFQGPQGFGIHGETIQGIARELKDVHALGVQTAIMVGGGNIFRGARQKGFEIERATYANWTFFAPILAGRTLMKITGIKPESENNVNVSALNGIFGKIFSAERFWLKNFNFPFGVSIVITAKKK